MTKKMKKLKMINKLIRNNDNFYYDKSGFNINNKTITILAKGKVVQKIKL